MGRDSSGLWQRRLFSHRKSIAPPSLVTAPGFAAGGGPAAAPRASGPCADAAETQRRSPEPTTADAGRLPPRPCCSRAGAHVAGAAGAPEAPQDRGRLGDGSRTAEDGGAGGAGAGRTPPPASTPRPRRVHAGQGQTRLVCTRASAPVRRDLALRPAALPTRSSPSQGGAGWAPRALSAPRERGYGTGDLVRREAGSVATAPWRARRARVLTSFRGAGCCFCDIFRR